MAIQIKHPSDTFAPSSELLSVSAVGALKIPTGTSADRPSSPADGMMRFNTTSLQYESFVSGLWQRVLVGTTGVGTVTSVSITGSAGILVSGSPITTSGEIELTLSNTGVSAGTHNVVTVNAQGRVTAGSFIDYLTNITVSSLGTGEEIFSSVSGNNEILLKTILGGGSVAAKTAGDEIIISANIPDPDRILGYGGSNAVIASAANSAVTILTGGQTRVTITSGGRVGIGVSNPEATLEISDGSEDSFIAFSNSTATNSTIIGVSAGSSVFVIRNQDASRIELEGAGVTVIAENTYTLPVSAGTTGQVLTTNGNNGTAYWSTPALEVDTSSVGLGDSIIASTSGMETVFKTIVGLGIIEISASPTEIVISARNFPITLSALDTGGLIIANVSGNREIQQRAIVAGGGIEITQDATTITISAAPFAQAPITASAAGTGETLIVGTSAQELTLKSLQPGLGIVLSATAAHISIEQESGVVTPGTYTKVTVDTYGRVTTGASAALSDFDEPIADVSFGSFKIINLANPTSDQDAATKEYVDTVAAGLSWKNAVRVATTGNITLANEQTIDGVALVDGDRVLVKNQNDAEDNGIYIVVDGGAWVRSEDFDGTPTHEVQGGAAVFVQDGTTQANTGWVLISPSGIADVGVDELDWAQFAGTGALFGQNGVNVSGNVIELTGQASSFHNLNTNGLVTRTGAGTIASRTLTGGTGISITNADGVAGNPVIAAEVGASALGGGQSVIISTSGTETNYRTFVGGGGVEVSANGNVIVVSAAPFVQADVTVSALAGGTTVITAISGGTEILQRSLTGGGIIEVSALGGTIIISAAQRPVTTSAKGGGENPVISVSGGTEVIFKSFAGGGIIQVTTSGDTINVSADIGAIDRILGYDGDNFVIASAPANSVTIGTDGEVRITITASGDVGIGTENPSSILEINDGTDNSFITFIHSSAPLGTEIGLSAGDTTFIIRNKETGGDIFIDGGQVTFRVGPQNHEYTLPISAGISGQILTTGGDGEVFYWTTLSPQEPLEVSALSTSGIPTIFGVQDGFKILLRPVQGTNGIVTKGTTEQVIVSSQNFTVSNLGNGEEVAIDVSSNKDFSFRTISGAGTIDVRTDGSEIIVSAREFNWIHANGGDNFATGPNSGSVGSNGIAIGQNAQASGTDTISIGTNAFTNQNNSIAIKGSALSSSSIVIGGEVQANSNTSIGIGGIVLADSSNSIVLGAGGSSIYGSDSIAIGIGVGMGNVFSSTTSENSISIGTYSGTRGDANTLVGAFSGANGEGNVVIGNAAGIGSPSGPFFDFSTSVGTYSGIAGDNSTLLGSNSSVTGNNTLLLGDNIILPSANSVFAIGNNGQIKIFGDSGGNIGLSTVAPADRLHLKNGTVRVSSAGQWYRLPISAGTNGQVLTTNGNGSTLAWSTLASVVITTSAKGDGEDPVIAVSGGTEIIFKSFTGGGIIDVSTSGNTIKVSAPVPVTDRILGYGGSNAIIASAPSSAMTFFTGGVQQAIFRSDGNFGIKVANPLVDLHVSGDARLHGGLQFGTDGQNVIYKGGTEFFIARNFNEDYTVFQVWAPPQANLLGLDREATLALVREDNSGNAEYMDVYNNGYSTETQHGIRIQRRGSGVYQPFIIDFASSNIDKHEALRIEHIVSGVNEITINGLYTLPISAGTAGQVLTSNGAGNTTYWSTKGITETSADAKYIQLSKITGGGIVEVTVTGEDVKVSAPAPIGKYVNTFNATSDWGSASGGQYTITVSADVHGNGANPIVQVYEDVGSVFKFVSLDEMLLSPSGNVLLRVTESPDNRFAGKYITS